MEVSTKFIELFLSLPLGETFLRWDVVTSSEEAKCPIILMLHGATVPSWQFDSIVKELLARSASDGRSHPYRVLRVDFYGHGRSARPNVKYNLDLFVDQALNVLQALNVGNLEDNTRSQTSSIIGVGHSMGAAVLAKMASNHPHLFHRIVLAAPMLDYVRLQPQSRLLNVPFLGELLMRYAILPKLKERRRRRYMAIGKVDWGERFAKEIDTVKNSDLDFPEALLRMFRHGALGDQSTVYGSLGQILSQNANRFKTCNISGCPLRVYVLWGTLDTVVNGSQIAEILSLLGMLNYEQRFNNTDHSFLLEYDKDDASRDGAYTSRDSLEKCGVTYSILSELEHNLFLTHPVLCSEIIHNFVNKYQ